MRKRPLRGLLGIGRHRRIGGLVGLLLGLCAYLLWPGVRVDASPAGGPVTVHHAGNAAEPLRPGINVIPASAFAVGPHFRDLKPLQPAHDLPAQLRDYVPAAFRNAHRAGFADPLARLAKRSDASSGSGSASPPGVSSGAASAPSVAASLPPVGANFDGLSNRDYTLPPDMQLAAGKTQLVEVTNFSLQVFDKHGNSLMGPVESATLFSPLGSGDVCATHPRGNPVVLYDTLADRWFVSEFAFNLDSHYTPAAPFSQCVAVSSTADATGSWAVYDFVISNTMLNDYGKFGVWPDAYYGSLRMFDQNQNLIGAAPVAFDRSAMLAGQPASAILNFLTAGVSSTMLPGNLQGTNPPPSGAPDTYLALDPNNLNDLQDFAFHVDFGTPSNSSFTSLPPISTAPYSLDLGCKTTGARNTDCVPQPNNAPLVDSMSDRLSFPANYRNFGDHESMVVGSTVDVDGTFHAGVRWYELRRTPAGSGNWTVYQQATQGSSSDSRNRWISSLAMDHQGDILMDYNLSSTTVNPSLYYAGRQASDPLGQLEPEAAIVNGGGQQLYSQDPRWGDYGAAYLDPTDDCTFWTVGEYYPATSQNAWRTHVASVAFPSCMSPGTPTPTATPGTPTVTPTATPTPPSNTATPTATMTATASGSTSTATGTPSTATPTATTVTGNVLAHDTFQRANQSGWGTASDGNVWAGDANSSASFSINNNAGIITNGSTNYSATLGPQSTDADLLFSGSMSSFSWTNLGAVLRYTDSNNWYKAYIDGTSLVLQKKVNGNTTVLGTVPFSASSGTSYSLRFDAVGSQLYTKVWASSAPEPANWMITVSDAAFGSGYDGIRSLVYGNIVASYTYFVTRGTAAQTTSSTASATATSTPTATASTTRSATATGTSSPTTTATASATPTTTRTVTATSTPTAG